MPFAKIKNICLLILLLFSITACGGKQQRQASHSDNIFKEAAFIKGDSVGDGMMKVTVLNPWDSTAVLADYLLLNPGVKTTDDIAAVNEGKTTVLQLPLKRVIVYSAVHAALLAELGYADVIAGVADADYIKTPAIVERLQDGRIVDIGSSMEPSLEKIISLKPDAVMISPFQNAGHGVIDKAGITVIECADYMEMTPLGRAEWSRFYAMLVEGIEESNSRIFEETSREYNRLAELAASYPDKPKVVTEWQSSGIWMMPGGCSYIGRMLTDAGAVYPFAGNRSPGSVPMNYEKAFMAAQDADFWLLKWFDDVTLKDIDENHPMNKRIWAYKNNGIYHADTKCVNLYEETPFHPDLLLADYVAIFHHTGDSLRYYAPVR